MACSAPQDRVAAGRQHSGPSYWLAAEDAENTKWNKFNLFPDPRIN